MSTAETTVYECTSCGGNLEFAPGTQSLACPYCGTENELPAAEAPAAYNELDYESAVRDLSAAAGTLEATNVKCEGCGAEVTIEPPATTAECAYCGTHVVATGTPEKRLAPQYILPFRIEKSDASKRFKQWIASRRFAPNKLKQYTRISDPIKGIYYPFWTFDSVTRTQYTGQRGVFYQEQIRTRDAEGKQVTRTVTKTRWYPAHGVVGRTFDDLLLAASNSIEPEIVERLQDFPILEAIPYDPAYLSGYRGESYSVELPDGYRRAKEIMEQRIRADVRRDIGGDTQRIISMHTDYTNVTFKYLVLPLYALKYKFREKLFPVVINGVTGEVQGRRPVSAWKIIFTVLGVAAVVAAGYFALRYFGII
jgi:DNA-directed RNA polymerase subunit RPC12/RpoP